MVPGLPVSLEYAEPTISNLKFVHDLCEERICAVYKFPPAIIGLGTGLEHADTRAAHNTMLKQAWIMGLIPVQDALIMQWMEMVLPRYRLDSRYRLRFDRSGVEALQDDLEKEFRRWGLAYRLNNLVKRSTALKALGLEVAKDGSDDVFYLDVKAEIDMMVGSSSSSAPEEGEPGEDDPPPDSGESPRSARTDDANSPRSGGSPRSRALTDEQEALLRALERAREEGAREMTEGLTEALDVLGELVAERYLEVVEELEPERAARGPSPDADLAHIRKIIDRIMDGWIGFGSHWQSTNWGGAWDQGLTHSSVLIRNEIITQLDLSIGGPDPVLRKVLEQGGTRRGLVDMERSTRQKLYRVLSEDPVVGMHPRDAAKVISQQVPAGPWSSSRIRGEVIARTETHWAQNVVSLDAYKEAGFEEVQAVDNQGGFNDADCSERDGKKFSLEEAEGISDHPNGTLNWVPVVEEL